MRSRPTKATRSPSRAAPQAMIADEPPTVSALKYGEAAPRSLTLATMVEAPMPAPMPTWVTLV